MVEPAVAGHAGETGGSFIMPHELMAGIVLLGLLTILLAALTLLTMWKLRQVERRLRHLEQTIGTDQQGAPPSEPRN
jgi:hypothetical protein